MHTRQIICLVLGGGLPMRKGEIWAWQGNLSRTNGYCYPGQQKSSTRPIKNMLQCELRTDDFMSLSFPPAILIILYFRLQLWLMHLLIYSLIWWPLWNLLHSYLSTLKISVTRVVRLGAVWWVLRVCCPLYQRQAVTKSDYHNYSPYPFRAAELLLLPHSLEMLIARYFTAWKRICVCAQFNHTKS